MKNLLIHLEDDEYAKLNKYKEWKELSWKNLLLLVLEGN